VTKILIVEDEPKAGDYLKQGLREAGYTVDLVTNGVDGLHLGLEGDHDMVILDVMLPGLNGWQILSSLRSQGRHMPVLFLTARDQVEDRVKGLELGADDYLVKPFSVGELMARVRVALRRGAAAAGDVTAPLRFGDCRIDLARRLVTRSGEPVHLTPVEYRLLAVLAAHDGQVLTHRQLLREVWGPQSIEHGHYLRIYMGHLRRKLEADPAQPQHLLTETGVGYRFVAGRLTD
jgi:DNA-binding response OmpR family regulator